MKPSPSAHKTQPLAILGRQANDRRFKVMLVSLSHECAFLADVRDICVHRFEHPDRLAVDAHSKQSSNQTLRAGFRNVVAD